MDKTTPNPEQLRQSVTDFYEAHGASFASTRLGHWSGFDVMKPFLQSGKLVVDVGAGNGRLAAQLPKDVPYLGIEPSSSFRAAAPQEVQMLAGGFPELPVPDETSFTTCCFAVFQHVLPEDVEQCRNELVRITKKGGAIIVTSWLPSLEAAEKIEGRSELERWIPWKADAEMGRRYVHCPSLDAWKKIWDISELELVQIGYIHEQGWTEKKEEARNLCVIVKRI